MTGQPNNSPADSPRLLLIDDDLTFSTFALQAFARAGLSADLAPTGRAGLETLAHRRFSLVFLDLILPDMNGLEVLRSIGQIPLARRPPVVLISGLGSIPSAVNAMHLGARTFIEKPLTADDLVSAALTHLVSLPTDGKPVGRDAEELAQWMAEAVFAPVDVPTVDAWARRCRISDMTLFARCRKLDLKAKRLLDLSRLLRAIKLTSGNTSRVKHFKKTADPRTVRALLDRAGLKAADLDTLDFDTFLAKQCLLQEPGLIAEILGLLRGGTDPLRQAP